MSGLITNIKNYAPSNFYLYNYLTINTITPPVYIFKTKQDFSFNKSYLKTLAKCDFILRLSVLFYLLRFYRIHQQNSHHLSFIKKQIDKFNMEEAENPKKSRQ